MPALEARHRLLEHGDALVIRQRWAKGADIITAIGILLVDTLGIGLLVASGLHVWAIAAGTIAAAATYAVLARLVNWTFVVVTADGIEIVYRPLPWFGQRRIAKTAIVEICCRESPLRWDFGGMAAHSIEAITEGGPVRLYNGRDVDSEETERIATAIRAKLDSELLEDVDRA